MSSKSRIRSFLTLTSSIALLSVFLTGLQSSPLQAIDGGSAANGNPFGVRIWREYAAPAGWFSWNYCSAGLLKPRVVVTAAHCLKDLNSEPLNPSIYVVYPPGVNVTATPTVAQSTHIFVRPGFNYESKIVVPNDIAFMVINKDIGGQSVIGVASGAEINELIGSKAVLEIFGYGSSSVGKGGNDPKSTTAVGRTNYGRDFEIGAGGGLVSGRICPGDSGSPVIAKNAIGQSVFASVVAGSSLACDGSPIGSWTGEGPILSEYRDLLDQAYAAAGYPLLPSSPVAVRVQPNKNGSVISWQAPLHNASSVNVYRVFDGQAQLCEVKGDLTSCTVPGFKFTSGSNVRVQALNQAGDGALSARVDAASKQSEESGAWVSGTYEDPPLLNSKKAIVFCYNPKTKKTKGFKRNACPEGWSTSQAASSVN